MTLPTDQQALAIRKASNRAAAVTVLGVLFLLGSLGFSAFQLNRLADSVAAKQAELRDAETRRDAAEQARAAAERSLASTTDAVKALEAKRTQLQAEVDSLEKQWEVASKLLPRQQELTYDLAAAGGGADLPLAMAVRPRASATILEGKKDPQGRQLYRFELWLEVPARLRGQIARTTYLFNHPSFGDHPRAESTDAAGDYRVSYQGWGALSRVIITITRGDGQTEDVAFDMYRAIAAEAMAPGGQAPPEKGGPAEKMHLPEKRVPPVRGVGPEGHAPPAPRVPRYGSSSE